MKTPSKAQMKLHDLACELLKQDTLTVDQRAFVDHHWRPEAEHNGVRVPHLQPMTDRG
jgi:hypothetical protein